MQNLLYAIITAVLLSATLRSVSAELCADGAAPRAAVHGYLLAMKEHRFEQAYDFVSATMTDGKPRDMWAGEQKALFNLGDVKIGDLDVRAAHVDGDDVNCKQRAVVPNVLKASDMFNNQGSTEFELYRVVVSGEKWKIDSQETLFEEKNIHLWFPEDEIPEFKDQL